LCRAGDSQAGNPPALPVGYVKKYERGRDNHPPGELSARAVLTNERADAIRMRCSDGSGVSQRVVAAEFRVSQITVSRIVRGLRYVRR